MRIQQRRLRRGQKSRRGCLEANGRKGSKEEGMIIASYVVSRSSYVSLKFTSRFSRMEALGDLVRPVLVEQWAEKPS